MRTASNEPVPIVLFVYDTPNVIKTIEAVLGRMPLKSELPSLARVSYMLKLRAQPRGALVDKRVYVNKHLRDSGRKKAWMQKDLPRLGYKVLTEVKHSEDDPRDVDEDMVWIIEQRVNNPLLEVVEIIVASNDTNCFRDLLNNIAETHPDILLTLVGFEEMYYRRWYEKFDFLDWRDIEGVFTDPLPRLTKPNLTRHRVHPPKTEEPISVLASASIQVEPVQAIAYAPERGGQFVNTRPKPWKRARR